MTHFHPMTPTLVYNNKPIAKDSNSVCQFGGDRSNKLKNKSVLIFSSVLK